MKLHGQPSQNNNTIKFNDENSTFIAPINSIGLNISNMRYLFINLCTSLVEKYINSVCATQLLATVGFSIVTSCDAYKQCDQICISLYMTVDQ